MKHVKMAFSFYLISEETKGYFAISRQISAIKAPKAMTTAKLFQIQIAWLLHCVNKLIEYQKQNMHIQKLSRANEISIQES